MSLPTQLPLTLMQTQWKSQIDPLLANPIFPGILLSNISMTGSQPLVINHLLSRKMQGWFVVDNMADAVIWRTQPLNAITLTLEASADTIISLWVF